MERDSAGPIAGARRRSLSTRRNDGFTTYTQKALSEFRMHATLSILMLLVCSLLMGCVRALFEPDPVGLAPLRGLSYFELELDAPLDASLVRSSVPWVEVVGTTGVAELYESDLVIAVDVSNAAMLSSGLDLDRDGVVGSDRFVGDRWAEVHPRHWTTDPGDTLMRGQLEAANTIVDRLALRRNRIGFVTYDATPRVRVALGESPPVSHEIARLNRRKVTRQAWTGANIASALRVSQRMLDGHWRDRSRERARAILLFTGGEPTLPESERFAASMAVRAARAIAAAGTRIYVFAFPGSDPDELRFLERLAVASNGALIPVSDPLSLLADLGSVDLKPESISIMNLTSKRAARAVRTERAGEFSGVVPLAEGPNEIEVSVVLADGRRMSERRIVRYTRSETPTEAERREAARLLLRLRSQTEALENDSN